MVTYVWRRSKHLDYQPKDGKRLDRMHALKMENIVRLTMSDATQFASNNPPVNPVRGNLQIPDSMLMLECGKPLQQKVLHIRSPGFINTALFLD